ncbi:hypothetical protein BABINDRAFT_159847 [Babjeviella inositovora NRRL Y-12698]|uniref:Uncharacterized protein n=1 Tax=Babjeviella inositovora NRRL Y-12698 TaxID=984486 RepID=A0A1E3QV84_9ASCO|nr:uncharacterized protein BABINDRAFT_159847 [Babjeviella inositovora NRRL Y-12698]ODQ81573.1 hypothetical protein BABINDRAFT_159847 [Babjeviella inositovora NRRL Y-12698]
MLHGWKLFNQPRNQSEAELQQDCLRQRNQHLYAQFDCYGLLPYVISLFLRELTSDEAVARVAETLQSYSVSVNASLNNTVPHLDAFALVHSFRTMFWQQVAAFRVRNGPVKAEALLRKANEAQAAKKAHRALVLYTEALHWDRTPHILANRAAVFTSMRDYKSAIDDLVEATALNPAHVVAWSRLGYVYLVTGDSVNAVTAYVSALQAYDCVLLPLDVAARGSTVLAAHRIAVQKGMLPQYIHRVLDALCVAEDRATQQGHDTAEITLAVAELRARLRPSANSDERVSRLNHRAPVTSDTPAVGTPDSTWADTEPQDDEDMIAIDVGVAPEAWGETGPFSTFTTTTANTGLGQDLGMLILNAITNAQAQFGMMQGGIPATRSANTTPAVMVSGAAGPITMTVPAAPPVTTHASAVSTPTTVTSTSVAPAPAPPAPRTIAPNFGGMPEHVFNNLPEHVRTHLQNATAAMNNIRNIGQNVTQTWTTHSNANRAAQNPTPVGNPAPAQVSVPNPAPPPVPASAPMIQTPPNPHGDAEGDPDLDLD